MKSKISTGVLFAMLLFMAMLPRTGHSQEIDPNAYYEIVSSNNLVLDNQDSEDDGTQIFINNRVENRMSQVWQLTTPATGSTRSARPSPTNAWTTTIRKNRARLSSGTTERPI